MKHLIIFFLISYLPVMGWGQVSKTPQVLAGKIQKILKNGVRRAVQARQQGYRALLLKHPYNAALVQANIRRALVQVVNVGEGGFHSSGFIFEEFFKGKRTVWAAVPYHTSGSSGAEVYLRFFDGEGNSSVQHFTVNQGGGWGINSLDVSLIKLPEELAEKVFALRLSDKGARVGEVAQGYGYMCALKEDVIPGVYARRITDTTGFKLSGDYQLPPAPSGFCGAPVISSSGYVLGMHCGSEKGKQTFAVSAAGIKELLRAFYFGHAAQPVKILGKTLFEIEPFQSIGSISLERAGRLLERVDMDYFRAPFTYARAENVFRTGRIQKGDVIIFEIVERGRIAGVIEYRVGD